MLHERHIEDAIRHMKKHDPKLAVHLDETAVAAFRERLGREDGSNPFM